MSVYSSQRKFIVFQCLWRPSGQWWYIVLVLCSVAKHAFVWLSGQPGGSGSSLLNTFYPPLTPSLPWWLSVKNPLANAGGCRFDPWVRRSPGGGMATHSRILAWAIPWTEEPGRQAMVHGVAKRVRHDLEIKRQQSPPQPLVAFFFCITFFIYSFN